MNLGFWTKKKKEKNFLSCWINEYLMVLNQSNQDAEGDPAKMNDVDLFFFVYFCCVQGCIFRAKIWGYSKKKKKKKRKIEKKRKKQTKNK